MTRRRCGDRERPDRLRIPWGGLLGVLVLGGVSGCFPPDEGQDPNDTGIYFPTGLALSPVEGSDQCGFNPDADTSTPHKWLYVANSDFDLQYNAGTVQVFDLDLIDAVIEALKPGAPDPKDRCPPKFEALGHSFTIGDVDGKKTAAEQFVSPGLCRPVDTTPLVKAHVRIGAFATDIRYLKRPRDPTDSAKPDMLVVPVRGDDTLHWIDTNPNPDDKEAGALLVCGADEHGACDSDHRRGDNASEDNTRNADLPREPFGIAADARGETVVTTHQSDGALALFVNDWSRTAPREKGPHLQFVLQDPQNIPTGAVGVASIPEPDVTLALRDTNAATFYQPGYYATFRNAAKIALVRYFSDTGEFKNPELTYPGRPFLEHVGDAAVLVNSQGFDSRGVVVDNSKRHACECSCTDSPGPSTCRKQCVDEPGSDKTMCDPTSGACANYVQCLRGCASKPLDVFVSNRTPATLIPGQTSPNSSPTSGDDLPNFYQPLPTSAGPSRVVAGSVRVPDGKGGTRVSPRVFLICFDSRAIFVYDPEGTPGRFESVIRTGRGPHSLVIDEKRGKGYVGHFTDSYIGVIDLDQSHPDTYGTIVLTIGQPTAPRAQK